jgi:hypothetical protein
MHDTAANGRRLRGGRRIVLSGVLTIVLGAAGALLAAPATHSQSAAPGGWSSRPRRRRRPQETWSAGSRCKPSSTAAACRRRRIAQHAALPGRTRINPPLTQVQLHRASRRNSVIMPPQPSATDDIGGLQGFPEGLAHRLDR